MSLYSAADYGIPIAYSYKTYELIRCPFHNDTSPSGLFFKRSGDYTCKSCGFETKGPVEFAKALDMDPEEFAVERRKAHIPDLTKPIESRLLASLTDSSRSWEYFSSERQIESGTVQEFGSSLATAIRGKAIGFVHYRGKRRIGVTLRHIEPTGSRYSHIGHKHPLWPSNGHKQILPDNNYVFVFEGAFKLLRFYQELKRAQHEIKEDYGVDVNEIGFGTIMGSSGLKEQVIRTIHSTEAWKRLHRVVYIGDNDKAGRKIALEFKDTFPRSKVFIPEIAFDDMSPSMASKSAAAIAKTVFSPPKGDLI